MKYIIHIGICGFGNQLLGFKELCIISKYLNRTIILPIFIPHGTIRNACKKYYEFKEIFNVNNFKKYYNCVEFEKEKFNQITNGYIIRPDKEYGLVKSYLDLSKEYYDLSDSLVINKINKQYIKNIPDLKELKNIEDEVLVLIGTFNNLKLSTCNKNGCLNCKFYDLFKEDYNIVTKSLVFNNNITQYSNNFLKCNNLCENNYITFHIRTPDIIKNLTFKEAYNNLDEIVVYNSIKNYLIKNELSNLIDKIFIAIPPSGLNIIDMKIFNSDKVILMNNIIQDKFILSMIELDICNKSRVLIYSPTNTPYMYKEHTRSSFTLLSKDYRSLHKNTTLDTCITSIIN